MVVVPTGNSLPEANPLVRSTFNPFKGQVVVAVGSVCHLLVQDSLLQ